MHDQRKRHNEPVPKEDWKEVETTVCQCHELGNTRPPQNKGDVPEHLKIRRQAEIQGLGTGHEQGAALFLTTELQYTSRHQVTSRWHIQFDAVPLKASSHGFSKAHGRSSISLAGILQVHVGVTSNRNIYNGIRAFCTTEDLSIKKCVTCNTKDLRPMTEEAANTLMSQVPEWSLVNDGGILKLHKSWKVKTFIKGLNFFELVGCLAETEENDFILAVKIDRLNVKELLRREVAKPTVPSS
nr:putative pterin-4-alpha-carbinolamine dehydratase [Ipomoea batatas]